jgi:hypothetical protein
MAAWAKVVAHHTKTGGRFPTSWSAPTFRSVDLLYVYSQELVRNGVDPDVGLKHIMRLRGQASLSDQVNALYNASDVGLSIGDGYGSG